MRAWMACFAGLGLVAQSLGAVTPTAAVTSNEGPAYIAPQATIHVVSDAENEVYGAFLTQIYAKAADSGPLARQTLLLENDFFDVWQPKRRAWEQYLLKRVGGQGRASDEALRSFLERPQQIIRFYSFPALDVPVRLLRSDILRKGMQEGGWDAFYETYPKTQGILSLSTIGFNAAANEAVFVARLQCGKRCGYRDIVFMRKVNGAWTLIMKDGMP